MAGIADAEHFLDFQVGGDAQLVEVDELLADRLHGIVGVESETS